MIDIIYNTAFTIVEQGITWVELLSVISGLLCVFLAGRNNKFNFWIGYVYNIFLFLMFLHWGLYSAMLLQPIALGMNAFGQWRWSHPKKEEQSIKGDKSLKVSSLGLKGVGVMLVLLAVTSIVWGFVLSNLGTNWYVNIFKPDPSPYLDAFLLMLTLIALYLSAQKKWECWVVWLFVNIFNIILYIIAGLVFMPIVSALYLLNGIWSLFTWYRLYKKENAVIKS